RRRHPPHLDRPRRRGAASPCHPELEQCRGAGRKAARHRPGHPRMKRISIVGFGLIGGSLSLALRRNGAVHVTAIDRAPVLARAEAKNAADEHLPLEETESLKAALERSDLTVLAVPVSTIIRLLPWSLT